LLPSAQILNNALALTAAEKENSMPIPMAVDLRPNINRLNIAVRQQTNGNCAVFAMTFLHEYIYRTRLMSDISDLSEEYLRYVTYVLAHPNVEGGANFLRLSIGHNLYGVCSENQVPQNSYPVANLSNSIVQQGRQWVKLSCDFIKNWDHNNGASQAQINRALSYLAADTPVSAGFRWPKAFATSNIDGVNVMDVPASPNDVFDGHAVCLVGYHKGNAFPGGGYFIVRNHAGTGWQDNGYTYMPFDYVKSYCNDLGVCYAPKYSYAPLKKAIWTHGSVAKTEYPQNLVKEHKKGRGKSFVGKKNSNNWFHIPLTTPVICDGVRPKMTKVFVFYKAGEGAAAQTTITDFHLYDGYRKIRSFNGLELRDDHSTSIDNANTWWMNPPREILYGLNISLGVAFKGGNDAERTFHLAAAGADFK
jgi:hypothetical protein